MATVKITELPEVTTLNSNTSNTLLVGVNLASGVTGKYTATTLASGLYSHNPLKVGNNNILFPDTIGQFSGTSTSYLQVNLQNVDGDGSGDYIITANNGTDVSNYLDVGLNGSSFSDPEYSSMSAYDGYFYVHGASHTSSDGNLIIGTASSGASIRIIAGGLESSNIVGTITKNNIDLKNDLIVRGNIQITNTSNFILPDSTFAASNNFVRANDTVTLTSAKTYTDTANTFLRSNDTITLASSKTYTDTANTNLKSYSDGRFLANVSNTLFNGVLHIGDKLNVNGSVIFANTNFSNTEAALTIAACPIGDIQLPSNDGYMLHISGKQNVSSRIVFDSFGANTYAVIAGRTARGTPTAPQAVANGDVLMRVSGNGYGTTKYSTLGSGRIDIVATENFTDTTRATQIQFYTTVAGTNVQSQIATFNGASAVFNGVVNPQKGLVLTPNVISGNVSSLGIDVSNNSIYKVSCNGPLTISLNNYQAGKIVEVWLTHYGNNNDAITHGCLAGNATKSGTSFNVNVPTLVYMKYLSVDGDQANTYVSINYG